MTQEFHLSITPVGQDTYLIRTERMATGVRIAEEQVTWPIERWLQQTRQGLDDPILSILQQPFARPDADLSGDADAPQSLLVLGQELYTALFQGSVRDSWMAAQSIAQHRREGLRLRVGLPEARLHQLPWEVLHDGDRPLATGTDIVFSRYQVERSSPTFSPHPWQKRSEQPLRILMVTAAPTDQERLLLRQEFQQLSQELVRSQSPLLIADAPTVEIKLLEQPGRAELTQALEQGNYQVFHYAGHSDPGPLGGSLYLVNSKTGLTEILNGEDLAGLLVNNGIRMAVLNSCRGNYDADPGLAAENGQRNLAQALLRRGVPGVLAMAERIPDEVAITLSRLFYRNLKQGYPVDLSLSRARQGLISAYGSQQLYWALPVLYLHHQFDGYVAAATTDAGLPLMAGYDSLDLDATANWHDPEFADAIAEAGIQVGINDELSQLESAPFASEWDDESLRPWLDAQPTQSEAGSEAAPAEWPATQSGLPSGSDVSALADELDQDTSRYADDAATVANLIEQLSHTESSAAPTTEPSVRASQDEILLPDASSQRVSTLYRDWTQPPAVDQPGANPELPYPSELPYPNEAGSAAAYPSASPSSGESNQPQNPRNRDRKLLWAGIGAGVVSILAAALLSTAVLHLASQNGRSPGILDDIEQVPDPIQSMSSDQLAEQTTGDLTTIALVRLQNGNVDSAADAVEVLLDRGALPQAETVLAEVPSSLLNDPTINFLKGRLAWQFIEVGNADYSASDARRYWEAAVADESENPLYQIALGFAYYAEDRFEVAAQTWLNALSMIEEQQTAALKQQIPNYAPDSEEYALVEPSLTDDDHALTAYAGLALASAQLAQSQPDPIQTTMLSKAHKLYRTVISNDAEQFQTLKLAQNWLWSESAIADWQTLPNLFN
ncbi:MAG: CHAT domain-containing protein [Thainema sp.]